MIGLTCLVALWYIWFLNQTRLDIAVVYFAMFGVVFILFSSDRGSMKKKEELAASMDTQHPGFSEFYANRQQRRSAKIAKGALLAGAIGAATVGIMARQAYDESFGRK